MSDTKITSTREYQKMIKRRTSARRSARRSSARRARAYAAQATHDSKMAHYYANRAEEAALLAAHYEAQAIGLGSLSNAIGNAKNSVAINLKNKGALLVGELQKQGTQVASELQKQGIQVASELQKQGTQVASELQGQGIQAVQAWGGRIAAQVPGQAAQYYGMMDCATHYNGEGIFGDQRATWGNESATVSQVAHNAAGVVRQRYHGQDCAMHQGWGHESM